jgi:hypothetical protein
LSFVQKFLFGSTMKFAVIAFPYATDTDRGTAAGPDALLRAGFMDWLREKGHDAAGPFHAQLMQSEEAAYGAWNKDRLCQCASCAARLGCGAEQGFSRSWRAIATPQ